VGLEPEHEVLLGPTGRQAPAALAAQRVFAARRR
jgi:hypothetical protein